MSNIARASDALQSLGEKHIIAMATISYSSTGCLALHQALFMPYEGYYSCKCSSGGTIFDSHRVFNNANERDDVIWTSMVACYAQQGDKEAVFQLFNQMQVEGVKPNSVTCLMICLVCSSPDCLKDGLNEQAVMLLEKMQKGGVPPNQLTYVAVLKGCVQLMNIELGMQVHACIMENSLQDTAKMVKARRH
ncbi:hypothetical protein GOP47_0020162 [Adiantum capillus-veneris]|uniref:Pentatricopeptide repeat-containing protein n=1 Tax=Adiantum capillus-veneris TaxID=13818 RepID=A0A9D4Z9A1_ADICA|nr:hypothetical protein GOP47_0020162 [Adiantum capillus-veneris]